MSFSHVFSFICIVYLFSIAYKFSGGLSDEAIVGENDIEIHNLVQTVQSDVYKALKLSSDIALEPKSYSSQIVNGTNYFVKVYIEMHRSIYWLWWSMFVYITVGIRLLPANS